MTWVDGTRPVDSAAMASDPQGASTEVVGRTAPEDPPIPAEPATTVRSNGVAVVEPDGDVTANGATAVWSHGDLSGNGAVVDERGANTVTWPRPGPRQRRPQAVLAVIDEAALTMPRRRRAAAPQTPRRGRRVRRVVRRIELWSVLKLALVFYACMYVVTMGALVVIWGFAYSAGLVDNFESFANDVGFENWQFYGQDMFRQAAMVGAILVVAFTVLTMLATALVNVISELTGGIRFVVIEEDVVEPGTRSDAAVVVPPTPVEPDPEPRVRTPPPRPDPDAP